MLNLLVRSHLHVLARLYVGQVYHLHTCTLRVTAKNQGRDVKPQAWLPAQEAREAG